MPTVHSSNSIFPPITEQPMYPHAWLIRGRVGYAYVFKQYGLRRVICKYYYPYNPNTASQSSRRFYFYQAVKNWQGFNVYVKGHYNALRYPKFMSGYNRYISLYMNFK
jgi:hypothetical protein